MLFGDDGKITATNGDMDTLIGFVTNYDAKLNKDGTYDCSITMVSKNTSLLENDYDNDESLKKRLSMALDVKCVQAAAEMFPDVEDLFKADISMTPDNVDEYNMVASMFAAQNLANPDANVPSETGLKTGVHWQSITPPDGKTYISNEKNIYISWGVFEDVILNPVLFLLQEQ